MSTGGKARQKASKKRRTTSAEERHTLVDAIMGKYAWVSYSSEDLNRDKRRGEAANSEGMKK